MKAKTNQKQLAELRKIMDDATLAYRKYLKQYNEEHEIKGGTKIQEIIAHHKAGRTKQEIVDMGYNKNTVRDQIRLFEKGKRTVKTTVSRMLPEKVKK